MTPSRRQAVDNQPLVVHTHRHDLRTGGRKGDAHRRIAGILDGHHCLAWRHQDAGQEIESLLCARRHDHILGPAHHGTSQGDMVGDGFAQMKIALIALRDSCTQRAFSQDRAAAWH